MLVNHSLTIRGRLRLKGLNDRGMSFEGFIQRLLGLDLVTAVQTAQPKVQLATQNAPELQQSCVCRRCDNQLMEIQIQTGDLPNRLGPAHRRQVPFQCGGVLSQPWSR